MASPKHEIQQSSHRPYATTYANAAARTGATGFPNENGDIAAFSTDDLYRKVLQTDDNSEWILTAITPTWVQVGGSGAGTAVTSSAVINDETIVRGDGGARGVQDSLITIDDSGNLTTPAAIYMTEDIGIYWDSGQEVVGTGDYLQVGRGNGGLGGIRVVSEPINNNDPHEAVIVTAAPTSAPAIGFGVTQSFEAHDDVGVFYKIGLLKWIWRNVTGATRRTGYLIQGLLNATNVDLANFETPTAAPTSPNARGAGSTDLQSIRNAATQVASGVGSFVANRNNTASGSGSAAFGDGVDVSGDGAFGCGTGGQASGAASHKEGVDCVASTIAAHAEGNATTASGSNSHAEGDTTTASGWNTHAGGVRAVATLPAQMTRSSGMFSTSGDTQHTLSLHCFRGIASHTLATWFTVYLENSSGSHIVVPVDTTWTIDVLVCGITQGAAQHWNYQIYGAVVNDGGTVTVTSGTPTAIFESDVLYNVQLAADTTNDALLVQVQRAIGGTDYDIRWSAWVRMVETTYPA